ERKRPRLQSRAEKATGTPAVQSKIETTRTKARDAKNCAADATSRPFSYTVASDELLLAVLDPTRASPLPDCCAAACDNGLRCRCNPGAQSSDRVNQAGTVSCLRSLVSD